MRVRLEDILDVEPPQAAATSRRITLDDIVSVEPPAQTGARRITLDDIVSVEAPRTPAAKSIPAPRPDVLAQLRASMRPVASHSAEASPLVRQPQPAPAQQPAPPTTPRGRNVLEEIVPRVKAAITDRVGNAANAAGDLWDRFTGLIGPDGPLQRSFTQAAVVAPAEALASTADMLARSQGVELSGRGSPEEIRQTLQQTSQALTPEAATRSIFEDPAGTLGNAEWWASVGGQTAGSIAGIVGSGGVVGGGIKAAAGGMKLAPAVLAKVQQLAGPAGAALVEAWMEGSQGYSEALASGATPKVAAEAAAKRFALNAPLIFGTSLPVFNPATGKRVVDMLLSGGSEGVQEGVQQGIGNAAARTYDPTRPLTAGMAESTVVGTLAGVGAHGAMNAGSRTIQLEDIASVEPSAVVSPTSAVETRRITLDDIASVEPPPAPGVETAAPGTRTVTVDDIVSVDPPPAVETPRVTEVAPNSIRVDPARFQFKSDTDAAGVTRGNKIDGPWNETISGVLLVWQDPADGQTYVVNGHHRLEAAKRLGAERVAVRYVQAQTSDDAKLAGALTNIAEDKGTPVDAAKILRTSPDAAAVLRDACVSANTKLAREGAALSRLSDPLFQRVATGTLDEGFGVAIGEGQLTPEDQAAVVTLIERQQAKGRELTARQVRTLIQDVKASPAITKADDQMSIFSSLLGEDRAQSVAVEKAVLRDWLMSTLAKDKRLFGYVAKSDRAERLTAAGNVIDVDASKAQAQQAATIADVVDRLAQSSGPVSAALTQAATRLASGENANAVRTQLLDATRAAVNTELGVGTRDVGTGPLGEPAGMGDVSRGATRATDRGGDRGPSLFDAPADTGNPVADVLSALEQRLADRLSTGELQPRLPGDVGAVRDVEVAQPKIALPDADFNLTPPTNDDAGGTQQPLFDPQAATGSPTRRLYDTLQPSSAAATPDGFRGRAVSEPQVIERMQDVFSRPQRTPNVLERLVIGQGSRQLPVRRGGHRLLNRQALGLYFPKEAIIRLRKAGDLATFSHELGHHIDFALFEEVGRPVGMFKGELMQLGLPTTPKSKYNTDYHVAEGVAEYFRTWFADPAAARTAAPTFTAALEDVMANAPGFAQQLREGQGLVQRYLRQPMSVRGAARVSVVSPGLKGRATDVLSELRSNSERGSFTRRLMYALKDTGQLPSILDDRRAWWDRLASRWTDRHQAINRAILDYAPDLPSSLNAYTLTRLADKAPAMAEGAVKFGPRGLDGTFLGPGLEAVLKPVHDRLYPPVNQPDKPSLVTYLIAQRAQELRNDGRGREPGMAVAEATALIARTQADPDFARIEKAADGVYAYLKGLRRYAEAYGALSADQVAQMEEAMFYVPMQRVREMADSGVTPGATKYADRQSPIKRLFGSGRDIIDPIESIVRHTFAMTAFVERNRAARELALALSKKKGGGTVLQEISVPKDGTTFNLKQVQDDILTQLIAQGFIDPAVATGGLVSGKFDAIFDQLATVYTPTAFGKPGQRILFVVDEGKRRFFQIQDEALYQNLVALGPGTTKHIFELAGQAASILRAGVTLRPTFVIKNLIRDTLGALFQSRHGFVPVWDTARGLLGQLRTDEDYKKFMSFGIQQATLLGNDRRALRAAIDQATTPVRWRSKLFRPVTSPLQFVQEFSAAIETATRLGEFKLALDSGGRERRAGVVGIMQRLRDSGKARPEVTEDALTTAALAAADVTVDFTRGGTLAKEISSVSAFFNARVQGLVRAAEVTRRDPLGVALTATSMAALTMILWHWNHDDEAYHQKDAQQKRDYWFIRLPGVGYWLTIPKPFVWSGIANAVEAALDETLATKPESLHPFRDFVEGAGKDLVLTIAPSIVMPTLEALANWDFYRSRNVVSPFLEKKEPDLQVNDWNSDTFRVLGKALGVSPAKLEHWATKTAGGAVRDATGVTDVLLRFSLLRKQPERPSRGLESIPGLQAILSPHRIDSRASSIDTFWDEFGRLERAEQSFKAYAKGEGQTDARTYGKGASERWDVLTILRMKEGKKQLDALYDEREAVYAHPTMDADEKRRRVDALHQQMARIATAALRKGTGTDGR
jgi:ParB-like chromosome segregation protein Spo0J